MKIALVWDGAECYNFRGSSRFSYRYGMDAVGSSETLVSVCQSTWQNIPKDDVRHSHRFESSKFHLNSPGLSHLATEPTQTVGILSNPTTTFQFIQHTEQEAKPHNTGECKDLTCCTCEGRSKNGEYQATHTHIDAELCRTHCSMHYE
jgi:hypothetical protein